MPRGSAEARARAVAAHRGRARSRPARATRSCAATSTAGCSRSSMSAIHAGKYIGGLTLHSDHAGSGRAPLEPVPAAKQRAALDLLATHGVRGRQLPLLARVPERASPISDFDIDDAQALGRARTGDRRRRRPAGARHAAHRARAAAGAGDRAAAPQQRAQGRATARRRSRSPSSTARCTRPIWSEVAAGRRHPAACAATCSASTSRASPSCCVRPAPQHAADARALLRADAVQAARRARHRGQAPQPVAWRHARTSPRASPRSTRPCARRSCARPSDLPMPHAARKPR